jgi:hypothetical protein
MVWLQPLFRPEVTVMLSFIALIISVVAVLISFISLWKSSLSPFKLFTISGELRLRIYPIKNGEDKWYIASLVIPISFVNTGAKLGQIRSIRVLAKFPELKDPSAKEIFQWYGEIDKKRYDNDAAHLFKWQQTATIAGHEPFILLPGISYLKYMVFTTRWDHPVGSKNIQYILQISTDGKRWTDCETWAMSLSPVAWSELTENATSIGVNPKNNIEMEKSTPQDLHELIRIKGDIPKGGFEADPSYLDYPSTKKEKNANK